MTIKMNGQMITMTDKEFCDKMLELCKAVTREGKDWNEYLAEIRFEIVNR